jgi:hypothetical protein
MGLLKNLVTLLFLNLVGKYFKFALFLFYQAKQQ